MLFYWQDIMMGMLEKDIITTITGILVMEESGLRNGGGIDENK